MFGSRIASSALVWLALVGFAPYGAAMAGEYRLGPQDKLKIKAYDWRSGSDDTHQWTALTGEFTVSASGNLSLPIVGDVKVLQSTTAEVTKLLAQRMQDQLGLARPPFVAIEVSELRPFYILGAVQKPGEYAYRPGLTVLQATSIAGGLQRAADASMTSLERDVITSGGEVRNLAAERLQLLMRQARLKAQIDGSQAITLPAEIAIRKGEPAVTRLVAEETMLFDSSRRTLDAQLAILQQSKALLQQEVKSLAIKEASLSHQVELAGRERQNVDGLVSRGLTISSRQTSVEQSLAQFESSRLDVQLATLKAQQSIAQTDRDSLEVRNKSQSQSLADANETRVRLAALDERIRTAEALLYEAEVRAPDEAEASRTNGNTTVVYRITREDGAGGAAADVVTDGARVEPGDTIQVERRRTRGLSASANAGN